MIESQIVDDSGNLILSHVGDVESDPRGLIVYSADYREYNGAGIPLTDETGSAEMAVDASIGGTPEVVYLDDPTTNWTNTALSGTWDFASTAITPQGGTECIDATGTVNGSIAQIERSSSISLSGYTALSGYIYITRFEANDDVDIYLRLAGVLVGNSVTIRDYVNVGNQNTWLPFVIPLTDFGLTTETIDQVMIETVSGGGQAPNYYLDTINIEETGGKLFSVNIPEDSVFELFSINYMFRDNITTLEPNQIMGVSALTNGIVIRTEVGGRTSFGAGVKTFAELIAAGARLDSTMTGASETMVNFIAFSPAWTRLKGDDGDRFSFFISDNLSGLTSFRATLRGRFLK